MLKKERAKVNIYYTINTKNSSTTHDILQLPLSTKILVQREKKGQIGLYKIKSIKGRDIILKLENSLVKLRYTYIKPYYYIDNSEGQKTI